MEEIKTLERIIEQYEECKRNCEEFTVNSTALYREEYEAIENLINKYKEQEKMIEIMAKDIEKITGSCPFDLHNYQVEDCDNICQMLADNGQQYTCFIEYYEKKAKGE